jgi:hypothetical protein
MRYVLFVIGLIFANACLAGNPVAIVTSVSPPSGTPAGGTSVTITGSNFASISAVHFGGTAATAFTVNSTTSITATSPAGAGTVDVTVTNPGGTSATSAADQYTYAATPVVLQNFGVE